MARAQSSFAISAALCSKATMVRPESSATILASDWPLDIGANGTIVAGLSGAWTLIATHSIAVALGSHSSLRETVARTCGTNPKSWARKAGTFALWPRRNAGHKPKADSRGEAGPYSL